MKHEMTSFHTMELKRNVLFQTHLLFVTLHIHVGRNFGNFEGFLNVGL